MTTNSAESNVEKLSLNERAWMRAQNLTLSCLALRALTLAIYLFMAHRMTLSYSSYAYIRMHLMKMSICLFASCTEILGILSSF